MQHSLMSSTALTLAFLASVLSPLAFISSAQASEVKLSMEAGLDDNPFRLSNRFKAKTSAYVETAIKAKTNVFGNAYLRGKAVHRAYDADARDADNTRASLALGIKNKTSWLIKSSSLDTRLSVGFRDKTYVSRTSGRVGESQNSSLEKRYNYGFVKFDSELKVKWSKSNRSRFYLEIEKRDYEDYSALGLSNFNYADLALGTNLRHRVSKKHTLSLGLESSYRHFDDRREKRVNGDSIAGSDLSYNAWKVSAAYYYALSKRWKFLLNSQYDIRFDSGPGYYDWERLLVTTQIRYSPDKRSTFRGSVTYSDDRYNQRTNGASLEDSEFSEQQVLRYRLSYERKLKAVKGLSFNTKVSFSQVEADLPDYTYDRAQMSMGLGYKF